MSKLQAIQIDEDTIIYVEATDDVVAPEVVEPDVEVQRGGAKGSFGRSPDAQIAQSFKAIESTIRTYTKYTLNAFKDAALAEVEKVTLEFGMNVSGSGGVPYIAAGTMGCNIKITVECAFPKRQPVANPAQQMTQSRAQPSVPPLPQRSQPAMPVNPQVNGANS
ncbi:CU044_2847 family protein [Leptolyngbya sp. 7M]|uniref:CU044_2847 family protein n=1 Tax=Leptolyngbya sp. 7M TaxID=2812896 RepID=UPI001B8B9E45|nr:CU044_2847 family protein [Leptolyngbya sp. 7M]QYO63460.1 hypothetical protein JVX88_26715 [Leptolyngbya sp. 7M]